MRCAAQALIALACGAGLAGCASQRGLLATVGPDYRPADLQAPDSRVAGQWQAPLPHDGSPSALQRWWQTFDDPVLSQLQAAAQQANASLAQAAARIERARADAVAADVAGYPSLDASLAASRSTFTFGGPPLKRDQASVGLQSSWEIDLFGGLARQRESAAAALQSSNAAWHEARVSVAAETATAYLNLRACEQQLRITQDDADSRNESRRLTQIAGDAGFQAPATVALARAVAAEGNNTLAQRQASCEIAIKGLVDMTGLDEPTLRAMLTGDPSRVGRLPEPPPFRLEAVPARVLRQRPDVAGAERDLAVASANIGVSEAERYPGLSLAGNITPTRLKISGTPILNVTTWSIGPTLSLPLFDGGRRKADVEAARAAYRSSDSVFRARLRTAAREVEEALIRVTSATARLPDAATAAAGYRESFEAAQVRQRAGLGSLIEAEQARRTALAAELAMATTAQERVSAWIGLYRAAGGGWDGDLGPTSLTSAPATPTGASATTGNPTTAPRKIGLLK